MSDSPDIDSALVSYLSTTSAMTPDAARRCIQEVLAYYGESLETFVQRRHRELQLDGELKNEAIYEQIIGETQTRRFAVTPLSTRQVRRMIYG